MNTLKKAKISLILLFLLGGPVLTGKGEVIPLPGLEKPDSIILFNGRLYVTDQGNISIYDMKDMKRLKTFGKAGEGPGEFKISPIDKIGLRIVVDEKNILVNSMGKFSIFSTESDFIEEKKVMVNAAAQHFKPFGNKYAGFYRNGPAQGSLFLVCLYDPATLKKEKEIQSSPSFIMGTRLNTLGLAMAFKQDNRRGPIYHVDGDRLFVEGEDCRINVYGLQGKSLFSIDLHKYEKLEITADFKKKVMAYLEKRLLTTFPRVKKNGFFSRYFPLRSFRLADGNVYVQTFKRVSEGDKSEFYIFRRDGSFLRKVTAPFIESEFLRSYPFAIAGGKLYQLIDNPDTEEWELHINGL